VICWKLTHDEIEVIKMLQNSILEAVRQRLQQEKLPVSIKLWNQQILGGDDQSLVTLYLSSPKALELLAKPSLGKLAEGYIKQKIDIQGSARDAISAITILFRNDKDGKKTPAPSQGWRIWRHSRRRDSAAVQSHYDVSDTFYSLWLDRQRVYSCAILKNLTMISIKRRSKSLIISAASCACSHASGCSTLAVAGVR
jgi:cyclopropane-fatty-acyl-phospholipid synthase